VQLLHEWRPDIVEIHFQAMAQYVTVPAKRGIPTILVDYDPASAWAREMLIAGRGPRRIIRRLEVAAWRHNERGTRPIFDAIVVFAQRDVAEIERHREARAIVRIPLAVEVPLEALNPVGATPPTVLFVGGFAHPPNVDAALWLAEDIFPRVRENVREARLELVGHQPTDEIRALANNWVAVHGSVPDVLPYLDRAAVVVAPIRRGGSMRMKVLEALAGGKALVATPLAAEGVDAVSGEHYVLAAETDDLAASVAELLVDPERRRRLAENARSWAEQNLGWQNGVSAFEELYRRLSENGAAAP
jgi:glycosyltransferase involved in cell wall biosynthesis